MATLRNALKELQPVIDSTANAQIADIAGNKTDTAATTVGTTKSIIAYLKGLLTNLIPIKAGTDKIDSAAVDGLSGVPDSLAYKVHEIEKHFHNSAQWFGRDAVDGFFNRDSVTSWVLTAGSGAAYGAEVQISDGTEIEGGSAVKKLDIHKFLVTDNNAQNTSTTFKLELWYGTGTFATATLLTECVANYYAVSDNHSVITLHSYRIACNNKIWARVKCSVDGKAISFILGLHTYPS